ncbi:MAG: SMP-30/gluconolactonase/LRE family protein [Actinomycetales bacterium]|nr:SMP-30/gluconolactonase/LRE family protein [Actinomycetales bacterium]
MLGEGLRWTGAGGGDVPAVVMVDIPSGRLLSLDPDRAGRPRTLARLDVPLGAVAPVAGGSGWVAAAGTGIALLSADGALTWLDRPEDAAAGPMRMNDGVCDPAGRFWAGSMAVDAAPGAGSLYRVDPDGGVRRVLDGLGTPNGPAFSHDGTTMYLADSGRQIVDVFDVDPSTGDLGRRRRFAELDRGLPDGMIVDDEGHLWAAVWDAGQVHRYSPDGERVLVLDVPARRPTSVCLVAGHRLLVSSATEGLGEPGAQDGRVLAREVGVGAPPARSFALG